MNTFGKKQIAPEQSISEMFQSVKSQVMGGGVKPLTQYQDNPLGFLTEVLGLGHAQLVWSENPAYLGHKWDGDRGTASEGQYRDAGAHPAAPWGRSARQRCTRKPGRHGSSTVYRPLACS